MSDNQWPPDAPSPRLHSYRLYTSDTTEESARIRFQDRYGQEPEWIIDHLGFLWVGPIPDQMLREVETL